MLKYQVDISNNSKSIKNKRKIGFLAKGNGKIIISYLQIQYQCNNIKKIPN